MANDKNFRVKNGLYVGGDIETGSDIVLPNIPGDFNSGYGTLIKTNQITVQSDASTFTSITPLAVNTGTLTAENINQGVNAVLDVSDIGTSANKLVQLDGSGRLPAVDGSQLTNLPEGFADPMTTAGDLIYRNSSNVTSRLGSGAANTVLLSDGTNISWTSITKSHISDFSDGDYLSSSLNVLEDSDFASEGVMYRNLANGSYSVKSIGTTSGTIAAGDHHHNADYANLAGDSNQDFSTQNLIVDGNLTVNGTTTTVNSTTIAVDDKNIELGAVDTPTDTTANGGGITLKGATDKTITWQSSDSKWHISDGLVIDGSITTTNGTVDGRNIGDDGNKLDGIETGATADQTAQEIANLIDADNTAESILKSALSLNNVENTALSSWAGTDSITTLGTITSGTWNGSAITDSYISSASTWNAKQNALTFGIANGNSLVVSTADSGAVSGEYARFTATGLESLSVSEVQSDLGLGSAAYTSSSSYDSAGTASSAVSTHESTYDHSKYIQDSDFSSQGVMYRNSSSGSYTTKIIGSDIQEFVDIKVSTLSTSSTSPETLTLFSTTTYSSAKLIIQAIDNSSGYRHVCELLVTTDGTNFNATQYGSVFTGVGELADYDVIDGFGACSLEITPASSNSTSYVIHITAL